MAKVRQAQEFMALANCFSIPILPSFVHFAISLCKGWRRGAGRWWVCCSLLDWAQLSYGHKARRDGAPRCATTICPSGSQERQPLDRVLWCFYSRRAWGVWLGPVVFLLDRDCGCTRQCWSAVCNVQRDQTVKSSCLFIKALKEKYYHLSFV